MEMNESEPLMAFGKAQMLSKTKTNVWLFWDEFERNLLTDKRQP
ncbi:hypothetical protein CTDIVETGP_1304 [Clostridium tyrobutyricum DIVETGP]|uniref:Uncharacterized protein n=1 Tax=Clostridium tyrobutyricum DIVETGP TaxID=1408889 RepID=W6N7E1_CLOTY|nr:hypothetical protein CTK_P00220 [Clostridium tyrobutyricum]CDL91234.1 hypothetical protein CTDIVETGP_1304 [Clostridium tyrobutyricum DIVETGP]